MVPHIDPKIDYAFKRLFGSAANVALLISLIEAILRLPPGQHLVSLVLLNPFNDKAFADDKLTILDIKATDQAGNQYNIEMQLALPGAFGDRLLYYGATYHGQQLQEGDDYRALRPTILICFLNDTLFADVSDHILEFELVCDRHPKLRLSSHQRLVLVELPKFVKTLEQLEDARDAWCYFLRHGSELDSEPLPARLRELAPIPQAMEVLCHMALNPTERERYAARLKAQRDYSSAIHFAREEGMEKGIEKGMEKGLVVGQIRLCQQLLHQPITPEAELLTHSVEDLSLQVAALLPQVLQQRPTTP